jgi:hypothetical protein
MKWITILAILLISSRTFSQSWSGSDNFNSSSLDTNKWTTYASLDGYAASANLLKTLTGISFFSPDSVVDERWGQIFWKVPLPVNENWSASVEASIDETFSAPAPGVSAIMTILSAVSALDSETVTIGLERTTNSQIGWNYQKFSSLNGNTFTGNAKQINREHVILKIEYNSLLHSFSLQYADAMSPSIFNTVASYSTTNWTNLSSFYLCLGGYSRQTQIEPNRLVMDNFILQRNTTNDYNTTVILQESTDLFNWSSISTNHLYQTDPKAFYRLQINKQ